MKKILTLLLIFGLTIQSFATRRQKPSDWAIDQFEKTRVDKNIKLDPQAPAIFNLMFPIGLGSFLQGDYIGGSAVLGCSLLGTTLIVGGILTLPESSDNNKTKQITGFTLIGIGIGTVLASYITSIIIPFKFANRHNENLKKELATSLGGFEPNFDIGTNGFQLSFKKSY
ncbi:P13 family porin [Borreliella bavariensis]|uniref:P13 family porin n=1 Tax=Borreliella bavariensis TaxID=664662 RepID=UPI001C005EB2|nr:P13 family porin [Borreliella bavariensis]